MRIAILILAVLAQGNIVPLSAQRVTIDRPEYRSIYDIGLRCPVQVEWQVCPSNLGTAKRDPKWKFIQDIPHPDAVATHDDFTKSGYHRGHMCPAADRSAAAKLMRSTFSLANICPQYPAVNTGAWKTTENAVRNLVLLGDTISVLTIPVFLNRDTTRIGTHELAVPHAFFKSAWRTGSDSIIGCWFIFNHR